MKAFCPYCKKEVEVVPWEPHETISRKIPRRKKRLLVKHMGAVGEHVFRTERDEAKGSS